MVMARWAGEAVLRYVREAPLESLPAEVVALEDRRSATAALRALRQELVDIRTHNMRADYTSRARTAELETKLSEVRAEIANKESAKGPDLRVIARIGRALQSVAYKVHDAGGTDFCTSPDLWRTRCGRRFGAWTFVRHASPEEFPADIRCRDCFGDVSVVEAAQSASSTSASSSEGESV